MAPITNKRRRGDDNEVRRPKKKVKKVKPIAYHSSDESEEEDAAQDAPKRMKVDEVAKPVTLPLAKPKPKSILKAAPVQARQEERDRELESEDEDSDEVARNTAFNSIPAENGIQSDEEEESAAEPHEADEPDLASSDAEDVDEDEASDSEGSIDTESETSLTSSQAALNTKRKRNDPAAFATSISKILSTKLTTAKRTDPVLSRSKSASEANATLSNQRLENRARQQIRSEKKAALEKGRVKDVLGVESEGVDTGRVVEEEKMLKKTAQRGVVKLFNAVRAAQVKGEEAMKSARKEGVVGMRQREERVNEMSKQGFLDLISSGGKKTSGTAVET